MPYTIPLEQPPSGTGMHLLNIEAAAIALAKAKVEGTIFIMPYEPGSVEEATVVYKSKKKLAQLTQHGPGDWVESWLHELDSNAEKSVYKFPETPPW